MKRGPKPEDLKLAKRCAAEIRKLCPDAEVIFYGSRARGKPQPDSDLDLLVLVAGRLNLQRELEIIDAVYPLDLETGIITCPIVEEQERWRTAPFQATPLAQAISKEGIRL